VLVHAQDDGVSGKDSGAGTLRCSSSTKWYRPSMSRFVPRQILLALAAGYVVLALYTRAMEASGAYACGCDADCWCKTSGLSLFRWVFPRRHKNRSLAEWKAAQVSD
jgi:hypothetical protein